MNDTLAFFRDMISSLFSSSAYTVPGADTHDVVRALAIPIFSGLFAMLIGTNKKRGWIPALVFFAVGYFLPVLGPLIVLVLPKDKDPEKKPDKSADDEKKE